MNLQKEIIIKRKKDPRRVIEVGGIIITLIISLSALFHSIATNSKANYIAKEQNVLSERQTVIAEEQKNLQNSQFEFEQEQHNIFLQERSNDVVGDAYDRIMFKPEIYEMREIISNGQILEGKTKIRLLIDEFEGLGTRYCNREVYKEDLRDIGGMLEKTCTNHQIEKIFAGKKNGFSKICLDIVGEHRMGQHYQERGECEIAETKKPQARTLPVDG